MVVTHFISHIKTFNSLKEAGEKTNSYCQAISACCRKKLRKTNNFYWCFEKDLLDFTIPPFRVDYALKRKKYV